MPVNYIHSNTIHSQHSGTVEHAILLAALAFGAAEFALLWHFKGAANTVAKLEAEAKKPAEQKQKVQFRKHT